MKFGKLFIYAVCVSLLAAVVDLVTNLLQGSGIIATDASLTFISFICWATYFLFGANLKGAWSAFLGIIVGIIAAILMFVLVNVFAAAGLNVSLIAIPLAVFILVIFMLLCEKLPYFNNIAAIFLGTGMFFGLMGTPAVAAKGYATVAFGELLYAAIGFAAGWITIQIRVAIENSAKKSDSISM
jgi:hypothetical protein